jgi:hypothetical protein
MQMQMHMATLQEPRLDLALLAAVRVLHDLLNFAEHPMHSEIFLQHPNLLIQAHLQDKE